MRYVYLALLHSINFFPIQNFRQMSFLIHGKLASRIESSITSYNYIFFVVAIVQSWISYNLCAEILIFCLWEDSYIWQNYIQIHGKLASRMESLITNFVQRHLCQCSNCPEMDFKQSLWWNTFIHGKSHGLDYFRPIFYSCFLSK